MSENTIGSFYNDAGFKDRHTPHGWRASFSNIMNEWCAVNGTPGDRQIINLMLAHVPEGISSSETVYNRGPFSAAPRAGGDLGDNADGWHDAAEEPVVWTATIESKHEVGCVVLLMRRD